MDEIQDCFVKFFLQQASEIHPSTIQALIDNGYHSKMSVLAMDLVHDLPLISEINLAQRSLLRKYIAALQEHSPFYVNLINEPTEEKFSHSRKKRKFDVYIEDSGSEYQKLVSPVSNASSSRNSKVSTDSSNSSSFGTAKASRLSFSSNEPTDDQEMFMFDVEQSQNKRKSGASKKKETIRTPSQIRFEKERQKLSELFETKSQETTRVARLSFDEPTEQEVLSNDEPKEVSSQRKSSRFKKKETIRTPSQIRFEKERQNLSVSNADTGLSTPTLSRSSIGRTPFVHKAGISKEKESKHVPTAAELAVIAKIQQKNNAETTKRRGRTRK